MVVGRRRSQGHFLADAGQDLSGGDDVIQPPAVEIAHIHVFDEAHNVTAALEAAGQVHKRVIVDSALDHAVDFQGLEACLFRGSDAVEHPRHSRFLAIQRLEDAVIQRVKADCQPVEAGVKEGLRMTAQVVAVGGQGNVVNAFQRCEPADQRRQVGPEQRFTAGQAQLADAQVGEEAHEAKELVVGQKLFLVEEVVIGAKDFSRHAVGAAEIALVYNRYAQIAQGAPETVNEGGLHAVESPSAGDSGAAWRRRNRGAAGA